MKSWAWQNPDSRSFRLIHVRRVQLHRVKVVRLIRRGEHFINAPGKQGNDSADRKKHHEESSGSHREAVLGSLYLVLRFGQALLGAFVGLAACGHEAEEDEDASHQGDAELRRDAGFAPDKVRNVA